MGSTDRSDQKKFFAEWLEKLQQESWQLELLISGFALYGVWGARPFISYLSDYAEANTSGVLNGTIDLFVSILMIGWVIFFTNLLVHIILRGLWIGAIGLRYVSGEIDYQDLSYSEKLTEHLEKKVGDFDDYIERLEKYSSIIFSYTFLLFFLFFSFIVLLVELTILISLLGLMVPGALDGSNFLGIMLLGFVVLIVLFIFLLIIIDVLTLGGLKRIKEPTVAKIYLFFYKIFSALSLSFIYRPILYNFLDNKFTRRLFLFGIPYGVLIAIVLPNFFLNASTLNPTATNLASDQGIIAARYTINPFYYDDLRQEQIDNSQKHKEIYYASLGNYENEGDFLKVFLRFKTRDEDLLEAMEIKHAPFSFSGLRFKGIFKKYLRPDILRDSIILEKSKERLVMKKVAKGLALNPDEIDSNYIKTYSDTPVDSIKNYLEKIENKWQPELDQRDYSRYEEIIDAYKQIHQFTIDSLDLTPKNCYFFTHPNLNEKGVICYLDIKQLPEGPHELIIDRKIMTRETVLGERKLFIPFFKN